MDTEVPAGQIAYINATDGAFAFNIAHTAVPEDAIKTPFTYSPDPNIPQGAFLGIPGGALACPMGNDVYKIYSDKHYKCKVEKSKCLSISLLAAGTKNNPAWQYE
ncbi:MAG: hypothetical protein M1828_006914 [Chrysothrix sp. TS-e1954]|nr:MAG: hypothetical protein M1828_006914 [Chrysothrix sp. TS-e1954]